MTKRNIEAVYPLSPMQQGMLFHSLLTPESGVYCEVFSILLTGEINVDAFEKAWIEITKRYSVFRTSFVWKRLDRMLQVVHKEVELPLVIENWEALSTEEQGQKLENLVLEQRLKGFDLSRVPLFRLFLLKLSNSSYRFVWVLHHSIMDGWSMPVVLKDLLGLYESIHNHKNYYFDSPRPYRDYIMWLQQQDKSLARKFWLSYLEGFEHPTRIRMAPGNLNDLQSGYAEEVINFGTRETKEINLCARSSQITLSTIIQSGWAVLLSLYGYEEDVIFGITVSGRPPELENVERMVGLFINTIPIRIKMEWNLKIREWFQKIQSRNAEVRQFEYSPLYEVQEIVGLPRETSLFDSVLVFENYPVPTSIKPSTIGFGFSSFESFEQTNYPLTVVSSPADPLTVKISYDRTQYSQVFIKSLLSQLKFIIQQLVLHVDDSLHVISYLTEIEDNQIHKNALINQETKPSWFSIKEMFELIVRQKPDDVALISEDGHLSYQNLNRQANQLAHHLRNYGVGPESLVGVAIPRSIDMIVAVLGVLKAGGAYVPLDIKYPATRLLHMLEDSGIKVIVTLSSVAAAIPIQAQQIICVDADREQIANESVENIPDIIQPEDLVYTIYTSGTTGQPKGVMVEHRSLVNLVKSQIQSYQLKSSDCMMQFLSFSFDASVEEIFPALCSGCVLYLPSPELDLAADGFLKLCETHGVTILHLPTAYWHQLVSEVRSNNLVIPSSLRLTIVGGESPSRDHLVSWAEAHIRSGIDNAFFINSYGPTETTVSALSFRIPLILDQIKKYARLPIGIPLPNTESFILSRNLKVIPNGLVGELFIGGVGVSRGYRNNYELTDSRFITLPYAQGRIYRTGDLACYLSDGNIEFLGRLDQQVKIRGFRIELGEIQAALSKNTSISEAVVLAKSYLNGSEIVAYVILKNSSDTTALEIREYLRKFIPEYMLPQSIVVCDQLPRTPVGKIDRRALLEMEIKDKAEDKLITLKPVEEILINIAQHILIKENVKINDNFFDLGGHSLTATQLASRIRDTFHVEIPLKELFATRDLADVARRIEQLRNGSGTYNEPISAQKEWQKDIPLSFPQQRLWFLDQLSPGNLFYNVSTLFKIDGKIDLDLLIESLNHIVSRHEVLRTRFPEKNGQPLQDISPMVKIEVPIDDLTGLPEEEQMIEAVRRASLVIRLPFNLSVGPLIRLKLIRLSPDKLVAVLVMHHIITDGWSMGIFIKELVNYYAYKQGNFEKERYPLKKLNLQYADFSIWQRNWLSGDVLNELLFYWKKQLDGIPEILDLPTDHPRPALQTSNGMTINFDYSQDVLNGLQRIAREKGSTLYITLLAAFQVLLFRYSNQKDIIVGTPIANRNHSEIEDLIGFFINTLAMRAKFSESPSFMEHLVNVRNTALDAYTHQDLPFELLVDAIQPERNLSHSPIFQVAYTLQNVPIEELRIPDVVITPLEVDQKTAKFDLTLVFVEKRDKLIGSIEFNTNLFELSTIEHLIGHFRNLLEGISNNPEEKVNVYPLLSETERKMVVEEWNCTQATTPTNYCAHELFEQQVRLSPDAIALSFEGQSKTYQELDDDSNRVGNLLLKKGVRPETIIGISCDRSMDMIVGLLGIMKAGGAYLPLDPSYPVDRLNYMVSDSGITVLLSQKKIAHRLPTHRCEVIWLDEDWDEILKESPMKVNSGVHAENLAYVIYTSGSTGNPKGTLLTHRGLSNLAAVQKQVFDIKVGSRILQFSPYSFDASVWEIFMALANGGTLCLMRQEVLAYGPDLAIQLQKEQITNITLPPSILRILPDENLTSLSTVIAAGEACTEDLVTKWAGKRKFFNAYGPTETTVCATIYPCSSDEKGNPPIGRPIPNSKVFILDEYLQLVPVGVPGELVVGGVNLARGYLNNFDLTRQRFILSPFNPEEKLYRTGDLVKYRSDGNIEYLGRIDQQVKVRGFRIELGEIESVINRNPDIQEAVVTLHNRNGDQQMVAYVITRGNHQIKPAEIKDFIRQYLPEYMVPSIFVQLEVLPLSPSGKVDKRRLPMPEVRSEDEEKKYLAPRNEQETILTKICSELLGVNPVGVNDNFFELGGHSLLATQFVSRIREHFKVEISLRTLFESPTIAELSQVLDKLITPRETDAERIARLLAKIDQLSHEEIVALIAEKKALNARKQGNHDG